ncbi:hypothetical protein BKA62DRAFT_680873 [Auriculariales sp. MPI-PUGE-AT-0066]|nr:hypothetical protein BKA62DRAFT_680873 [Auriculariales sp. MPI-PUGE-AT-0066]
MESATTAESSHNAVTYRVDNATATIHILVSDTREEDAYVVPNTTQTRLEDGTYDYNRKETQGEVLTHWQLYIGKYIAQSVLKLPHARGRQWRATLPAGYVLFSKCKSVSTKDPSQVRSDSYLKGSSAKFRSPQEFTPHYMWLLENGHQGSGAECICRWCGPGRKQRDINIQLGLPEPKRAMKPAARRTVVQTGRNALYTRVAPS